MSEPYVRVAEVRAARPDALSEARVPATQVAAALASVERMVERACQTSFVPRPRTHTVRVRAAGAPLPLPDPWVLSVTSCTAARPARTLDAYVADGLVVADEPWPLGRVNVSYVAGWSSTVPADLAEAVRDEVVERLLAATGSPVSQRATQMGTDGGGVIDLALPSERVPFTLPRSKAVLAGFVALTARDRPMDGIVVA